MSGKAAKILLTNRMFNILTQLTASRNASVAVVLRASLVLLAFQKHTNREIGKQLGLCAKTVGLWRRRWRDSYAALLRMQFEETGAAYRRAILACLSDAPRSGLPGKFTAEQIVGLIGIACEPPENSGRPVTTWTGKELADEARKRDLVHQISCSHVNRILREVDLQPHRSQYWCNTTEKDSELFSHQVEAVCQTYLDAPQLYHEFNTHTICVDEMTSLQANERRAETKLPRPGQTAKEEFQYTRHGTVCLTGNWHVVEGQMICPTISETRDNEDFAKHIEQTIATDSKAGWVIIVDNLNTHCGEPLVRMVANQLGMAAQTNGCPDLGCCEKAWHPGIDDLASSLPFGLHPSHSVCLHPQAQFMVKPDRDYLRNHQPSSPASRQLHFQTGLAGKVDAIRRLLQRDDCQTHELDLHRATDTEHYQRATKNLARI